MNYLKNLLIAIVSLALPGLIQAQEEATAPAEIIISVAEQRMVLVQDGEVLKKFPVSTSKFGIGDGFGSYRTPVGRLRISQKFGSGLPEGAVFKRRNPTGEILPVNAPGRDPIVTRILWLDGMDEKTANAHGRSIYIHGTPEERKIGKPVSYGCIRMRSRDVIEVYNSAPVGTVVTITTGKLPKLRPANRIQPSPHIQPEAAPEPEMVVVENRKSSNFSPRSGDFAMRW